MQQRLLIGATLRDPNNNMDVDQGDVYVTAISTMVPIWVTDVRVLYKKYT